MEIEKPEIMTKGAKVALFRFSGEDLAQWAWTEPSVWNPKMLTTLINNKVRGGKWHSLIDKIYNPRNLDAAYRQVAANKGSAGVDNITVQDFTANLVKNVGKLHEQLRDGTYKPQAIKRINIPKPGTKETRPLGIPTVRDRVVQGAVVNVLEPILEHQFAAHSYGFRPNRGCKDALSRVDGLIKAGYKYTLDVDLKSYFDTIKHERLIVELRKYVADNQAITLVEKFLQAQVFDGLERWTPTQGAPQGAVLSPLLSNLYLNELDHLMASLGYEITRYADDIIVQCKTREQAKAALSQVQEWVASRELTLHPTKTKIVHVDEEGFEFLGYRFIKHRRFPRKKSLVKLKDVIRSKTKRTNGKSLQATVRDLNRVLRGWFEYFKHSWKTTFPDLDGWIRMRLRSILRKRSKRKGRGRGLDHYRYPIAYFDKLGLFRLTTARACICQSSCR